MMALSVGVRLSMVRVLSLAFQWFVLDGNELNHDGYNRFYMKRFIRWI